LRLVLEVIGAIALCKANKKTVALHVFLPEPVPKSQRRPEKVDGGGLAGKLHRDWPKQTYHSFQLAKAQTQDDSSLL
jgi:hypothetical protein